MKLTLPPETNVARVNQLLRLGGFEIKQVGEEFELREIDAPEPSVTLRNWHTGPIGRKERA